MAFWDRLFRRRRDTSSTTNPLYTQSQDSAAATGGTPDERSPEQNVEDAGRETGSEAAAAASEASESGDSGGAGDSGGGGGDGGGGGGGE